MVVEFFLYYVLGYRKNIVSENIKQAFPGRNEKEIKQLAKKFYRHFADLFMEVVKARSMSSADFKKRCLVKGGQQLIEQADGRKRPVIILTIHQGNWEWMLHGASQHLDIPIDPVTIKAVISLSGKCVDGLTHVLFP